MNPWMLYNEMVNGTGKGWCTQNAQVYVFWANQAGIPKRFVFDARTQDNTIVYTGHAFAESYVREQSRWAYVDLTQGQIYMTNKNGEVLNTAELFQLNQHNAFDSTIARLYVDQTWERLPGIVRTDTVVSVLFPLCNAVVRNEFTAHSIFKYRRPPNVEDVREIQQAFSKTGRSWWVISSGICSNPSLHMPSTRQKAGKHTCCVAPFFWACLPSSCSGSVH